MMETKWLVTKSVFLEIRGPFHCGMEDRLANLILTI